MAHFLALFPTFMNIPSRIIWICMPHDVHAFCHVNLFLLYVRPPLIFGTVDDARAVCMLLPMYRPPPVL